MARRDEAMTFTEDGILGGKVRLRQPARGYRAGMDAALLAAACDARAGERVLDAGCGAGAVMLAAARRRPGAHFVGMERDPAALALAARNIAINDLGERVSVHCGDIGAAFSDLGVAPFDAVLGNPPFFDDARSLRSPGPERRSAWINEEGLALWGQFLLAAVRERGSITLIHRADRLGDIIACLTPRCGSIQVRPVHAFADAPAKRVIVRARKSGKAPLRLLPALVLHAGGGAKHTKVAEAILRGETDLPWL